MNCMKNLEKQVGKIFKMLGKIQDHQIKGECQLTNLARGVDFITQKFEEYVGCNNCKSSKSLEKCSYES